MEFYVLKNEEQAGPFSVADLHERLLKGDFAPSDLAWREGLTDWTPLKVLMGDALPDVTPEAVSNPISYVAPKAVPPSSGVKMATAIVVFVIAFVVIAAAAWLVASFICAVIVAAQAAAFQAQGMDAAIAAGMNAGRAWFWIFAVGAGFFSLILSPVVAWMMAFSNLFPWCRER